MMVLEEVLALSEVEEWPQSSSQLDPADALAPVALTGGLVGLVVDPYGLPMPARVAVRDRRGVIVGEWFAGSARAACAGGRFEVRGLPTGSYLVEIAAPGFRSELRHGVRIEAPCVTNLGPVRLIRADSPSITVQPRREESRRLVPALAWASDRFR